jgi:hypothetical protein
MPSKLKPALLLFGLAGGVVAALRKRAGGNGAAAPEETRRYAAPAEAGAQPPAEPEGAPSDDPQATAVRSVPSDPTDLATPPADAGSIGGSPDDRGNQP